MIPKDKKIFIALSLACAGLLAWENIVKTPKKSEEIKILKQVSGFANNQAFDNKPYFDADAFLVPDLYEKAWSTSIKTETCKKYRGAIINHHALASDLIVKMMKEIVRCNPTIKTVIILSPDHFNASAKQISFHRTPYLSAGKVIEIDERAIERLEKSTENSEENTTLFAREHGVGVLVPFLHRVLPEVYVVPMVIKSSITKATRNELSLWLQAESKANAFIIVSSDMSHYLDEAPARQNDERTKRALIEMDTDFFVEAKDAFTDNGPAIASTIEALKPTKWHLKAQAISNDYAGSSGFTTTYLVGFWE